MKFGNVVTTSKTIKFDLPINLCSDMSCVDENLPTLIIGYELAKKYIDGFNILKKYYPETNTYWTYKKNERGIDYEDDIESFYNLLITSYCSKVDYQFIDIVTLGYRNAKKLLKFISSSEHKFIFNENNRFIYVYTLEYKKVFGFSLSTAKFFGLNINKLLKLFKENECNEFIDDFANIPTNIKKIVNNRVDKYLVLYECFE